MKVFLTTLSLSVALTLEAQTCSNILINKGGYHIEGRTLDFFINVGFQDKVGYVGDKNTSNIIVDVSKIPQNQIATWTNKYGFYGRGAFVGGNLMDGMNTQGLSTSALYLPGTQYPAFDPSNKKPVLGIYDLGAYILSQASNVKEAIDLIKTQQLVGSALEQKEGVFIKDMPIHFVMRDRGGNSAVVEFLDGKVNIHENAGDVLTNAPQFDWQIKNANAYDTLKADNKEPNPTFSKTFIDYSKIYDTSTHKGEANLLGTPGDFTPPSRFARATILLNNFPTPTSKPMALYQVSTIIDSVSVPAMNGAEPTLWSSIKDLDDKVYYYKQTAVYQGNKSIFAFPLSGGYTAIDLKAMDFTTPDPALQLKSEATQPQEVKEIISANDFPDLSKNIM
jgi:choloylglycine hydrolase